MQTFSDIVSGKKILHVPIYSMFNRISHRLNALCDGNINRWLTAYAKANNFKGTTIAFPPFDLTDNYKEFEEILSSVPKIALYWTPAIRDSAIVQRSKEFAQGVLSSFIPLISEKDLIIVEAEELALLLSSVQGQNKPKDQKWAYWCPVCETNHKRRSFMKEEAKKANEKIFTDSNFDYFIIASKDQVEYLKELGVSEDKIIFNNQHIDRDLPMFSYNKSYETLHLIHSVTHGDVKFIYLPFRLTDEGYKIWEIVEFMIKNPNVLVLSSNVNGAQNEELIKLIKKNSLELSEEAINEALSRIQPISSSRDVFYTIIDECDNCVVPYFEDTDFIHHSTIEELTRPCSTGPRCLVARTKQELECILK